MMNLLSFVAPYVLEPITDYFKRKSELKNLAKNKKHQLAKFRLEKKYDVKNAEIVANKSVMVENIKQGAKITLARVEQTTSSLKDELILIFVLVVITLGAFEPTASYVLKAWDTLGKAPEIMQYLMGGAIAGALGIKTIAECRKKK